MEEGRLGEKLGYVLIVNTAIGSGYFAIPWAYNRGGWLLSLILEVLFLAVGYILALQVLEILHKARFLHANPRPRVPFLHLILPVPRQAYAPLPEVPAAILETDLDMVRAVQALLGGWWSAVYLITLTVYLEGCLITYVNDLGTAASGHWNLSSGNQQTAYRVSIVLYLLVAVYYCSKTLEKQMVMQLFMWAARLALVVFTLVLAFVALYAKDTFDFHFIPKTTADLSQCISVLTLAGMFQVELPTLLRHIRQGTVRQRLVFRTSMSMVVVYTLTGVIAGGTFTFQGQNPTETISNLSEKGLNHGLVPVFEFFVGILPAFIVFSAFPIHLFVVSDNLLAFLYGSDHFKRAARNRKLLIRLLCLLCPFAYCLATPHLVTASSGQDGSECGHSGLSALLLLYPSAAPSSPRNGARALSLRGLGLSVCKV